MRTLFIVATLLVASLALTPASAAELDESCKEIHRKVTTGVILKVDEDCSTQVDVKIQECVWGGYWDSTTAGPVTVRVYKCGPPGGELAEVMGPCPTEKNLGVGTLYLNNNCYAQLDIKFYDCIWGGHWDEYGNKVAKVRVYSCDPYPPGVESTQAKPCNGVWYYEETFAGVITVGTDGNPRCTYVSIGK